MRTLTAALTIVITAACCLAQQPVAVLQIDSFERDDALAAWELRETMAGETVREHATDGERAIRLDYPAYEQGSEQWPAAILNAGSGLLPSDWTGYEQLLCDIYVEADHAPQLRGQINAGGQKGQKTFTIDPGEPTTIAIDLQGLSSFLDLTEVEQLHLYMTRPTRPATVYVDNIRLAAYTISAEGLRFIADPFGGGKVGVAGRLSRAGQWRIGVVSEDDVTVAVDAGEGEDIDWRWDALTDEGLAAAPGIYRVIARIADPQRPGVRPEIAQIGEFELAAEAARHDMLVWSEPTTKKVMLHDRPETPEGVGWWSWAGLTSPMGYRIFDEPAMLARVEMARNEVEGVQIVTLTAGPERLRFEVGELTHGETGAAFEGEIEILQVGYAKTEQPPQYDVDFVGWWPEALIPAEQIPGGVMIAEPHECMPVWVNVRSTTQTVPGRYFGELRIHREGHGEVGGLPLTVNVHDVTLPDSTTIRTAFTLDPRYVRTTYGDAFDADLMMEFYELMADHRINPDDIYRRDLPDINVLKHFDERDQLNAFCVRYFHHSEDGQGYQPEDLAKLAEMLDPYVEQLREAGLAEKGYFYGWDERGEQYFEEIARVGRFLNERYPEIPLMTTTYEHTFGLESGLDEVDIWVPLTPRYDRELAEAARERGRHVWWYICIGPRHPYANWFVEYPAIEARLLWWMTYDEAAEGFLYYRTTRWP
ncbi:MAG: glycoside hydrolase domain-containing protein, partial [Armatimonadota bacterium]